MQDETNLFHLPTADRGPHRSAVPGWIYFLGEKGYVDCHIKIGWTNGRPYSRIVPLQSGNPRELELLGYLPGTEAEERAVHAHFSSARVRGEWFIQSPELREFVRRYTRKTDAEWQERPAQRPPLLRPRRRGQA